MKMMYKHNSIIRVLCIVCGFVLMCGLLSFNVFALQGRDGDQVISCNKIASGITTVTTAAQGGTNYGRYYIQTITGAAYFYLYDLQTNQLLATIPFSGNGDAFKNNNANFSTEFYSSSDTLPLLYVSSAYDLAIHVFRIYQEDGQWKISLVQTISYPTINNAAG